jgi:hypothetical protein
VIPFAATHDSCQRAGIDNRSMHSGRNQPKEVNLLTLKTARVMATMLCAAAWLPLASEAAVVVDIGVAPPPPRVVVVPPPRVGYVWAPGYWRWNGYRHVWVQGHWVHERRGWRWVPDQWVAVGPRWHFVPGHWER